MIDKNNQTWRLALKFVSRCPICSHEYSQTGARLFAEKDPASLVHLNCANCQSNFILMVMVGAHGLSSVGTVTDLTFEDVSRLYIKEPIEIDEVLNYYENIRKNKISFN